MVNIDLLKLQPALVEDSWIDIDDLSHDPTDYDHGDELLDDVLPIEIPVVVPEQPVGHYNLRPDHFEETCPISWLDYCLCLRMLEQ